MNFLLIFPHYISWHYTKAISDLVGLFKNFLWFIWNFFSIQLLLKTLFVPFKKLNVARTKRFDLEDFFSALVTNLLMRLVGFFVRGIFIIMGVFSLVLFIVAYAIFFILWLALPLLLLSMFVAGVIAILRIQNI